MSSRRARRSGDAVLVSAPRRRRAVRPGRGTPFRPPGARGGCRCLVLARRARVRRHGQEARLHRCDGALVRRPPARVRHAAPAGSARRAHVPRPGRHGRPRTPARRAGRRDGETRRVRSPRRRGLEPARVRAGAPDGGPPHRAQGLRGDARAGHPRDRAARALRRGGERGSCHDARRGGDRVPTACVSRRGAAERASPRRGRDRPRGSGRGHATSPGPTHRGHPADASTASSRWTSTGA